MQAPRRPQRTCIGCRQVFGKNEVVRIVSGPAGAVIDYREKLPGRAAYVCPRRDCIRKAVSSETLSRALQQRVVSPGADAFTEQLCRHITDRSHALLSMAVKAGAAVSGASAVEDALRKGRVELLIFACDVSEGTRAKLLSGISLQPPEERFSTCEEMGRSVGRELAGVVGIIEKGFADAVGIELIRLKGLRNTHP